MVETNGKDSQRDAPVKSREESIRPAPPDGPLLSLPDAASYLRMSTMAFRKLLETDPSEIGEKLRGWLVVISPRRRYITRDPFMKWLREKCDVAAGSNEEQEKTI